MGEARILFLGRLAQTAGGRERVLPLERPTSLAEIVAALGQNDPDLGAALAVQTVRVVVNQQVQRNRDGKVEPGDEIAFLPPVSGG